MKYFGLVVKLASLLGSLNANPNYRNYRAAMPVQQTVTVYVTLTNNPNSVPTYNCPGNPFNGQPVPATTIATTPVAVKDLITDTSMNFAVYIPTPASDIAPTTTTTTPVAVKYPIPDTTMNPAVYIPIPTPAIAPTTTMNPVVYIPTPTPAIVPTTTMNPAVYIPTIAPTTTTTTLAPSITLTPVPNPFNDPSYVNKVNNMIKTFINSPFTNTDISALYPLGSYIKYSYAMNAYSLPLPQPFTMAELSIIDSFSSTLIPSNGQSSIVAFANKCIDFFSSNDSITSKLVENGVKISKAYPEVVSTGSSVANTAINYVKQQGLLEQLKLFGFYNQYKSQYSNSYNKALALVEKYSPAFSSLGNMPNLLKLQ
jgi:hypothetical protein